VNASISLGYRVAGLPGTLAAFLGIVIPNAVLVILVAVFFFKICTHPQVKAAFYGLRPVITGIILFAAASFAMKNGIFLSASDNLIQGGINLSFFNRHLAEIKSTVIAVSAFLLMHKAKIHPIFVIIGGGVAGILLFYYF
jgi:chromate transporter